MHPDATADQTTALRSVSSSPSSFPCAECGRDFATPTSRNRHAKKHLTDLGHVCPICALGFHRQDILTRHMRLHDSTSRDNDPDELNQPANGRHGSKSSGSNPRMRKRCHTACDQCRTSKIRCDGQQPCSPCKGSGRLCRYDSGSNRVSRHVNQHKRARHDRGPWPVPGPDVLQDEAGDHDHLSHAATSSSSDYTEPLTDHVQVDQQPLSLSGQNLGDQLGLPMLECFAADSNNSGTAGEDPLSHFPYPSPTDALPWTWMHENAFLSDPANLSMMALMPVDMDADLPQINDQNSGTLGFATNPLSVNADPSPIPTIATPSAIRGDTRVNTQVVGGEERSSNRRWSKRDVIADMVSTASATSFTTDPQQRRAYWSSASAKLAAVFKFGDSPEDGIHEESEALPTFVDLYFDQFHPLWPLVSLQEFEYGSIHPLLFLTLSSIGAMYKGKLSGEYGSLMHTALCHRLTMPLEFEMGNDNHDFVWLAQARLLTQVAALYFGQHKAFSFAQHLGMLLVAQVRKLDLFSQCWYRKRMDLFRRYKNNSSDELRLSLWLEVETRRRLAFGIFRVDTFTSIVLGTKPLVSLDEIHLEFPACNSVWTGPAMSPTLALEIIDHEQRTSTNGLLASDIFHIMMERDEVLPPLEPLAHELLLFGLQYPLWRFSRDNGILDRLVGKSQHDSFDGILDTPSLLHPRRKGIGKGRRRNSTVAETESLDSLSREMADLYTDRERLLSALHKWERALPIVKNFVRNDWDRNFILSSLVLFHLGHMRLLAPVADAHLIQYHLAESRPVDNQALQRVLEWSHLPQARLAVDRLNSIWSLVTRESQVMQSKGHRKLKANLLAYLGLHHGVALLWAFVGCCREKPEIEWFSELGFETADDNSSHGSKSHDPSHAQLFKKFVDVYETVSPGRWSSFAEAAKVLADNEFPITGSRIAPAVN